MSLIKEHTLLAGKWSPQYRDVLARATGVSYNFPTKGCMVLQDELIRKFVSSGIWNNLDYLYIHGVQGNSDLIRINYRQPSKPLSTGSPTVVAKKGITGNITHAGFDIATDKVFMKPGANEYPCCQFVFVATGGNPSFTSQLAAIDDNTIARYHRIGVRTTPRTEGIINGATGNLFVIENGTPSSNETIHLEVSDLSGTVTRTATVNGSTVVSVGGAAGVVPHEGVLYCAIPSPMVVGAVGGGGGIKDQGLEVLLHTYLLEYFTGLNLL